MLESLRKTYVFNDFTDKELELFTGIAFFKVYNRGDVIFKEGEPGDALFIIEDGLVRISKILDEEKNLTKNLAVLSSGESFGEMALLDSGPRSAMATAVAESKLVVVPQEPFRKILKENPEAARKFQESNLLILCERLRSTNQMLSDILTKNMISRHELDKVRGEFLKVVSQELETPVSSLKNFSEMLADFDNLDEELRRDFVGIVVSQVDVLSKLVEQIMTLFEVSFGEFKLSPGTLDLDSVFSDLKQRYISVCETKEIGIEYRRETGIESIEADPKIALALDQILFNTVKYSDKCSEIKILARDVEKGIAIDFTGFGKGIPPDQMALLFDDMSVSTVAEENENMLGIGLPLAKSLIQAHKARLIIENRHPHGFIFTILWPVEK